MLPIKEGFCQQYIFRGIWARRTQCYRKIWKDGYCQQHHPETVKKREAEKDARWEKKMENSTYRVIERLQNRIKELEAEVNKLKEEQQQ